MTDQELLALPAPDFTKLVSEAFRNYASLLALARSPLAYGALVEPALVLDPLNPTADERGRALRSVLRWVVTRLSPTLPCYPLGTWRPYTDPTWRDPLWWGYNILRHRYVDPLPPDEREGGFTEALVALMGIPDAASFYKERHRALDEVARLLREQVQHRASDAEIRHLALEEIFRALDGSPEASHLVGIAATFRGEFPRALLMELARAEGLTAIDAPLNFALGQRLLQSGEGGTRLWIPPAVQAYAHTRQQSALLVRRHRRAVLHYRDQGTPLHLAWHLRMAGDHTQALTVLLDHAPALMGELLTWELHAELAAFEAHQVPTALWFRAQRCLGEVCRKLGDREGALAACQQALKVAATPSQRAQIYHRFGKLYEDHSPQQALDYYQWAVERFAPGDEELVDTLKDRAWVYIHLEAWDEAMADLETALAYPAAESWHRQAEIYNALASIHRHRGDYDEALTCAKKALTLRSEAGFSQAVAESWSNVALIYTQMGKTGAALTAYRESQQTFEAMGNDEAVATVQLNAGMALHLAGRLVEAVAHYEHALATFDRLGIPLLRSKACYNLAEANADLDNAAAACRYWSRGYEVAQEAALESEVRWYESLAREKPALRSVMVTLVTTAPLGDFEGADELAPEEIVALTLAQREGHVTPRRLIEATGVSKSTATRKLAHLLDLALLVRRGKGRGVHYVLA